MDTFTENLSRVCKVERNLLLILEEAGIEQLESLPHARPTLKSFWLEFLAVFTNGTLNLFPFVFELLRLSQILYFPFSELSFVAGLGPKRARAAPKRTQIRTRMVQIAFCIHRILKEPLRSKRSISLSNRLSRKF